MQILARRLSSAATTGRKLHGSRTVLEEVHEEYSWQTPEGEHLINRYQRESAYLGRISRLIKLKQRLADEPHVPVASSFRDESTAEQAISAALESNEAAIAKWLKTSKGPKLLVQHESASSLGMAVERGTAAARPSRSAQIVLVRDSVGGFYVLTAYLE